MIQIDKEQELKSDASNLVFCAKGKQKPKTEDKKKQQQNNNKKKKTK